MISEKELALVLFGANHNYEEWTQLEPTEKEIYLKQAKALLELFTIVDKSKRHELTILRINKELASPNPMQILNISGFISEPQGKINENIKSNNEFMHFNTNSIELSEFAHDFNYKIYLEEQ
ncbi:MAG: hypothetical protein ACTSUK_08910 [Promethearchaeota archaeon]